MLIAGLRHARHVNCRRGKHVACTNVVRLHRIALVASLTYAQLCYLKVAYTVTLFRKAQQRPLAQVFSSIVEVQFYQRLNTPRDGDLSPSLGLAHSIHPY